MKIQDTHTLCLFQKRFIPERMEDLQDLIDGAYAGNYMGFGVKPEMDLNQINGVLAGVLFAEGSFDSEPIFRTPWQGYHLETLMFRKNTRKFVQMDTLYFRDTMKKLGLHKQSPQEKPIDVNDRDLNDAAQPDL